MIKNTVNIKTAETLIISNEDDKNFKENLVNKLSKSNDVKDLDIKESLLNSNEENISPFVTTYDGNGSPLINSETVIIVENKEKVHETKAEEQDKDALHNKSTNDQDMYNSIEKNINESYTMVSHIVLLHDVNLVPEDFAPLSHDEFLNIEDDLVNCEMDTPSTGEYHKFVSETLYANIMDKPQDDMPTIFEEDFEEEILQVITCQPKSSSTDLLPFTSIENNVSEQSMETIHEVVEEEITKAMTPNVLTIVTAENNAVIEKSEGTMEVKYNNPLIQKILECLACHVL